MERLVLVVDDNDDICELCKLALEQAGYRVACARNGAEGLLRVQTFQPHLIVLDVMMPVVDGVAFLEELPQASAAPIPVIACSGFDKFEPLVEAAGAAAFLNKPFQMGTLLRLVGSLLDGESGTLAPKEGRVFGEPRLPTLDTPFADEKLREDLDQMRSCSRLYFGGEPSAAEDLALIAYAGRLAEKVTQAGEAYTPLHLAPGVVRRALLEAIVDAEMRRAERDHTHVELLALRDEPTAALVDRLRHIAGAERLVIGEHRLGTAVVIGSTAREEAPSRMDRVASGFASLRRHRFDPERTPFLRPDRFLS